jgi:hypothetical protein
MKILIGASDVCGLIHDLGEEFRKNGHKVTTVSWNKNRFYKYKYDLDPENLTHDYILLKTGSSLLSSFFSSLVNLGGKKIRDGINSLVIRNLLSETDCYIQIYTSLWEEERQLKYLKRNNKKIITLFVGSEIRDYNLFKQQYNLKRWSFTEEMNHPGASAKLKKLKLHEKYSDAIFSVPDQSISASRPYFHLQIPLKTEKFTFHIPEREIPIVLHAPSNAFVKGSDLILETLEKLKKEGVQFELRLLENIKHENLLKELTNADVLVDEIILHGPGVLSFEAMLSGCAVATRYLENSPPSFRPPVWNINEDNIFQQLKTLLTDKTLRINLATQAQEYALKNNNIKKVAADIINKINDSHHNYDYFPERKI